MNNRNNIERNEAWIPVMNFLRKEASELRAVTGKMWANFPTEEAARDAFDILALGRGGRFVMVIEATHIELTFFRQKEK